MKTDNLKINQLSTKCYEWYLSYLDALDARDVDRYKTFLSEDCVLIMNNAAPLEGKKAVLNGLSRYWQFFSDLEHDLLNIYGTDSSFMLEAMNHYQRLDGKAFSLRAIALMDRNSSGDVTSVRLHTDNSLLFE
ncbi:nuclear transport factor 2 family protein [Acaryochloris marina NIES-2412]|uniref:nuclear transport factor 2 family protein n=1 Tax=Acaryochloris marina TaxID=155978 RepID=UPI004057D225